MQLKTERKKWKKLIHFFMILLAMLRNVDICETCVTAFFQRLSYSFRYITFKLFFFTFFCINKFNQLTIYTLSTHHFQSYTICYVFQALDNRRYQNVIINTLDKLHKRIAWPRKGFKKGGAEPTRTSNFDSRI